MNLRISTKKNTTILCLCYVFFLNVLAAQPSKKTWMLGASTAGLDLRFDKDIRYDFNPSAGYFISNRMAVGIGLGMEYTRIKNSPSNFVFLIEPFCRYYFYQKPNFQIFSQLQVGYRKDSFSNLDVSTNRFCIGPGITYMLGSQVGLEAFIGYKWQRENVSMVNYSSNSNGILLRFGVQVFLGNSNKPQAN